MDKGEGRMGNRGREGRNGEDRNWEEFTRTYMYILLHTNR